MEPFILSGKDMIEHWTEDNSTDLMRRVAKRIDEYGCGETSTILENLADDFDLMVDYALYLKIENKLLQEALQRKDP